MTVRERATAACVAAFTFLLALSFAGCQPTTTTTTNTTTVNANANTSNANTSGANATNVNAAASVPDAQPLTLAVLDALFADESFARDLKSKLSLTDEQIAQLRKVAQEERAGLRESNANEGTTQGATARAAEKIRGVVGADKADQVLSFARERWASGGAEGGSSAAMSASPDHPNAVPTDTRVVVNAPAFRMDVFEQGRLVKSYKVGIGYPEFPLPAGMRKASQIVFNPEWTPPDEPWVEAGKSKVKVGEKVPAGSKLNPLGPIKIPIGLPSLIHGGKNPSRLGEFASHGCVGLTDNLVEDFALELARLGGTQLTPEDEQNFAKNKTETKAVKLAQAVPVELRYETIVATDDGVLHVYRDVYDRGTNTEENLRRVLEAHGVSFDQLDEQTRAQLLDALKQMARDALGNPAEGGGTEAANSNAKGANKNDAASNKNASASNKNASGAHVTRNVKGQKEIAIPVPQLQGKGYPVPVGDAFKNDQQNQQQKAGAAKKGKRR